MLRSALLGFGALLLLLGGVALTLATQSPAGLGPAGLGGVLLLALLVERHGYKRFEDSVPGPDWQPTGERFREPGGDGPVTVYYQPRTGKRVYVRLREPPAAQPADGSTPTRGDGSTPTGGDGSTPT